MAKKTWIRVAAVGACVVVLSALAAPQIKQVIKVVGVGAAVKQFGPDINRELNKLVKHKDTATMTTKVVPILSVGVGKSSAIGAAQVMGPKSAVEKVQAVASPEVDLFGKEIRIRAMIPVSSIDVTKGINRVDGVGVSGIVDLKL
ncbi:MAG TPA: hypothetical protein PLO61_09660 [Fimbriimonadaceae bacterium]|nr:hypothetical protein [Fimbriimonadaceae bacterium]HRJ32908.1 hypothetical protein [Fimbriimonadaceae bacterium]